PHEHGAGDRQRRVGATEWRTPDGCRIARAFGAVRGGGIRARREPGSGGGPTVSVRLRDSELRSGERGNATPFRGGARDRRSGPAIPPGETQSGRHFHGGHEVSEPVTAPPIADLSYRGYDGPLETRAFRWWIVSLAMIRLAKRRVWFWIWAVLSSLSYLF